MLRIMQETTQHETKPTIFGYFFHEFLQPDVYIPHPPNHCPNDTSFYPLLQKVMIT